MKKKLSITISAILLITLCACSPNIEPTIPSSPVSDTEPPIPQGTSSAAPPKTSYAAWGMPEPFDDKCMVDEEATFIYPYSIHKYNTDVGLDYKDYSGFTTEEEFDNFLTGKGIVFEYWGICEATSLLETANLFSLTVVCDIPNEAVRDALQNHNGMCDGLAEEFNDEGYLSRKFTEAEIEAILSRDLATAIQQFATKYAIVIDDRMYAPAWLYLHTPEDYRSEGITAEMVEQKLDLFEELYLTEEAATAFKEKLLGFIEAESIPASIEL